jgi:hypothetical protein
MPTLDSLKEYVDSGHTAAIFENDAMISVRKSERGTGNYLLYCALAGDKPYATWERLIVLMPSEWAESDRWEIL